jgi:hypothetical protein
MTLPPPKPVVRPSKSRKALVEGKHQCLYLTHFLTLSCAITVNHLSRIQSKKVQKQNGYILKKRAESRKGGMAFWGWRLASGNCRQDHGSGAAWGVAGQRQRRCHGAAMASLDSGLISHMRRWLFDSYGCGYDEKPILPFE